MCVREWVGVCRHVFVNLWVCVHVFLNVCLSAFV